MRFAFTEHADEDVVGILRETHRLFGPRQLEIYASLIDAACALAAEDPLRPSSNDRSTLGEGVRVFHVRLAGGRMNAASHVIYYRVGREATGEPYLQVLRVLHERMAPTRWIAEALQTETGDESEVAKDHPAKP